MAPLRDCAFDYYAKQSSIFPQSKSTAMESIAVLADYLLLAAFLACRALVWLLLSDLLLRYL